MLAKAIISALVIISLASGPAFAADDPRQLATQVSAILKTHCYRCHGQDGAVEGGMNYGTDLAKLVARKKVVPGDPSGSRLFNRIEDGTMPPPGEKARPNADEIAILKKWIDAGAPVGDVSPTRALLTTS